MPKDRIPTSIPAEFKAGHVRGTGQIRNVCPDGLFIGTSSIPEQGDSILLKFRSPRGETVRVSGLVWWTTDGGQANQPKKPGFGVRITDECESYRTALDSLR